MAANRWTQYLLLLVLVSAICMVLQYSQSLYTTTPRDIDLEYKIADKNLSNYVIIQPYFDNVNKITNDTTTTDFISLREYIAGYKNTDEYIKKLKDMGLEPTSWHSFKSPYFIDPTIWDDSVPKPHGVRNTKIISCFNCPSWFVANNSQVGLNRDFKTCPYSECVFDATGERKQDADLVFFLPAPKLPGKMPPKPQGQRWAYITYESPVNFDVPGPDPSWRSAFNWTFTYRQDSDIWGPNGHLAWRDRDILLTDEQYEKIARRKNKGAAWFVSNCQEDRMNFVKEMQKFIDIDIYGKCSDLKLPRHMSSLVLLNQTYKFYLAFENSYCEDYVTLKFFRNFWDRTIIIPIVRGGFPYEKYFPPNTYINAADFPGPRELAIYMKELSDDIPRYAAMLKEKDKVAALNFKMDYCEVCERLHTDKTLRWYRDLKRWTHKRGGCWNSK